MDRKKTIYFFIGILIIFLIIVEIVVFYLRRKNTNLAPDAQSQERIQTINIVLSSYFGNNWQLVLSSFLILLLVILALLFFITKKQVTINENGKSYKALNITIIVFLVILSLATLFGTYKMYSDIQKQKISEQQGENEKKINQQKQELVKLFLVVSGLVFFILLTLGAGLWGYRKIKNKKSK